MKNCIYNIYLKFEFKNFIIIAINNRTLAKEKGKVTEKWNDRNSCNGLQWKK